nr:RNA polymerase, subunit H/Rpb5, conserved site-containing protein [Ipomoea batatas]
MHGGLKNKREDRSSHQDSATAGVGTSLESQRWDVTAKGDAGPILLDKSWPKVCWAKRQRHGGPKNKREDRSSHQDSGTASVGTSLESQRWDVAARGDARPILLVKSWPKFCWAKRQRHGGPKNKREDRSDHQDSGTAAVGTSPESQRWDVAARGDAGPIILLAPHRRVIPTTSVMSNVCAVIPGMKFQSKWYNKCANGDMVLAKPSASPGHILLPAPKGKNSKWFPIKSIELLSNLSGIKLSGLSQYWGSLPIAHTLINTLAPCGNCRSFSSNFSFPLTSACALANTRGFFISSDIAHTTVSDDVSVPAIMDLILPDGTEGAETFGVEQLHHTYFAHLSPVIIVGRQRNVRTIVKQYLGAQQFCPGSKSQVVSS